MEIDFYGSYYLYRYYLLYPELKFLFKVYNHSLCLIFLEYIW